MMNLKSPKSLIIAAFFLLLFAEHVVIGCGPYPDAPGNDGLVMGPSDPGDAGHVARRSVKERSLPIIPASDVEGYFLQTDKNNDGAVDAEEWLEALKEFVEKHDLDRDGAISLDELKAVKEIFE